MKLATHIRTIPLMTPPPPPTRPSSRYKSPLFRWNNLPQILLFTQFRSFLDTTCILTSPVHFPSQDSSFHFALPTMASSTSLLPFFISTRQWHYLRHDRAPGNIPVLQVVLALYKYLYLLTLDEWYQKLWQVSDDVALSLLNKFVKGLFTAADTPSLLSMADSNCK